VKLKEGLPEGKLSLMARRPEWRRLKGRIAAQVVAHATEYPADRDGDGTGYDRRKKRDTAERQDQDTGGPRLKTRPFSLMLITL
jgi:hypothetical protein